MLNSITEIDRKGLFGRQASGAPISGGRPCRPGPRSRLELNAIARVGQDLDHKAFELDEFFLGHFFIDAQVPEKAITTLTRGFPLSKIQSICLAVSSESEHDRRMIAIAFLFVRLLGDCFKLRLAAASRNTGTAA